MDLDSVDLPAKTISGKLTTARQEPRSIFFIEPSREIIETHNKNLVTVRRQLTIESTGHRQHPRRFQFFSDDVKCPASRKSSPQRPHSDVICPERLPDFQKPSREKAESRLHTRLWPTYPSLIPREEPGSKARSRRYTPLTVPRRLGHGRPPMGRRGALNRRPIARDGAESDAA
ncbi:hypothetical protein GWI33_006983 [Rhynchophorus ferrugineus]|uniref:Uncharacterized protein n=1 Tax=Rhynchophorus ferrugineus TaxID=354439 RepID=A0A834IJH9_RHYFE|nr:hypothetical protein GWI33_006983 [Rhynchophorus ferrugineus]